MGQKENKKEEKGMKTKKGRERKMRPPSVHISGYATAVKPCTRLNLSAIAVVACCNIYTNDVSVDQ